MDIFNHEQHAAFYYYPSNAFRIGSKEEFLFFKNKWSCKSDRRFVRRIYNDFTHIGICPCRILFAFNVLNARIYRNVTGLKICEEAIVTKLMFDNEYQLKTMFFTKQFNVHIQKYNHEFLLSHLKDLPENCEGITQINNCNVKTVTAAAKRYVAAAQSRRKLERNEMISKEILAIARQVQKNVKLIKFIQRILPSINVNRNRAFVHYYRSICRTVHENYLQLDYFNQFATILHDTKMYVPKISKNKVFKESIKNLKSQIFRDCCKFWGIEQQRQQLLGAVAAKEVIRLPPGQILPINDNPKHEWYNSFEICKHENGYDVIHSQTRCNDEMITSFKYCRKCCRRIN